MMVVGGQGGIESVSFGWGVGGGIVFLFGVGGGENCL